MTVVQESAWFALQVAPKMETKSAAGLQARNYEVFLPVYTERRRWSDRTKIFELPLFPGYVFCRLTADRKSLAVATPGVRRIVRFGGKPYPVEEHEITALQAVMGSQFTVTPWPFMRLGQKVIINEGPLAGVIGLLSSIKSSHRLVISVDILMRSVAIDVDASFLSPMNGETFPNTSLYPPNQFYMGMGELP